MKQDASFGIIPLRKKGHAWEVLLIQHHAGHWGFPKGHANHAETDLEAAIRELTEETGLVVDKILCDNPFREEYRFSHRGMPIQKSVNYYLGLVSGNVTIQAEEILAHKWVPFDQVEAHLTFPKSTPSLYQKSLQYLS